MEIKLQKTEKLIIVYNECPRCHKPYNTKKRKKTAHHVLPKFLKPKTEITITICEECHNDLNDCYNKQGIRKADMKSDSETFEEFNDRYIQLREDFHNKKLDRGTFGEGLWSNIMSYLESLDKRVGVKKKK